VRSIEWVVPGDNGGLCFWRTMTGWLTLRGLGISALPVGGVVYRAGPDERRDVIAFCGGPGNTGTLTAGGLFLGHYFIVSGDDIIDFSVGDWRGETGIWDQPPARSNTRPTS
jgi:hypothetical protein